MPVFTDALLGDTLHLSAEEFGAYCLLLFATWRNNGTALPDDDRKMARICRVTARRWRERLRPVLIQFFRTDDRTWHQKRLEKEWQFVAENAAISRSNGAKGGRPKSLNGHKTYNPAGSSEITQTITPHTHTHTHKEKELSSGSPDPAALMSEIWNEECAGKGLLKPVRSPNATRRKTCLRRWQDEFGADGAGWRAYCHRIAASSFLTGDNPRQWGANFDWVLEPRNLAHIMEGNYDARLANGGGNGTGGPKGPAPTAEELFGHAGTRTLGVSH